MRYKYIVLFALVLLVQPVFAQVIITDAAGRGAISADTDDDGAWTSLTGSVLAESMTGDIGGNTITMTVPTGFEFDIGGTAPTVNLTVGATLIAKNINGVAAETNMAITS